MNYRTNREYETPNRENRRDVLAESIGTAYQDALDATYEYGMGRDSFMDEIDDALVRELVDMAQLYDDVAMNPPFGEQTPYTFRTSPHDRWVAFKLRERARSVERGETVFTGYDEREIQI